MAQTLEQIVASLGSIYDPQVNQIRQRQSLIPEQVQAEEAGLAAKQDRAYGDILSGARRRGMGFSGIPLAEQAKYSATEYMPALARLRAGARDQAMSLEDAILGIQERRNNQAQGLMQQQIQNEQWQKQFDEQRRQFDLQQQAASRAAAAAGAMPSLDKILGANTGGGLPQGVTLKSATAGGGGGYNFNFGGTGVSAARFAQLSGGNLMNLLYNMGNAGDKTAASALQELIKSNGKWTPQIQTKYRSLFWGV